MRPEGRIPRSKGVSSRGVSVADAAEWDPNEGTPTRILLAERGEHRKQAIRTGNDAQSRQGTGASDRSSGATRRNPGLRSGSEYSRVPLHAERSLGGRGCTAAPAYWSERELRRARLQGGPCGSCPWGPCSAVPSTRARLSVATSPRPEGPSRELALAPESPGLHQPAPAPSARSRQPRCPTVARRSSRGVDLGT